MEWGALELLFINQRSNKQGFKAIAAVLLAPWKRLPCQVSLTLLMSHVRSIKAKAIGNIHRKY
jgi:ABC-type uncharacterized transport system permease subunit